VYDEFHCAFHGGPNYRPPRPSSARVAESLAEKVDCDGTETASREQYESQAEAFEGPGIVLKDA
jgi:hypothetical protein